VKSEVGAILPRFRLGGADYFEAGGSCGVVYGEGAVWGRLPTVGVVPCLLRPVNVLAAPEQERALARGASPYDVAKLLGDTVDTLEKHYARSSGN
jgi:hypothetical protein